MKNVNSQRGSILVTVLFLVSVLALLVATVAHDSMQTLKTVGQSGRDSQAKYAAYAGLEQVMNQLRKDGDDSVFIGTQLSNPRHGHFAGPLSELKQVSYDVEIWNNMRKAPGEKLDPIDAPNDVKVQPDTVYMISAGSDATSGQDVLLTSMAGTARRVRPVFEDAAYARSKLIATGSSLVDAWDSEGWKEYVYGGFPGDPSSTPTPSAGGGGGKGGGEGSPSPTTENYKASLGTDSVDGRTLRLLGDSKLNGHFRLGPGPTDETAFGLDSGTATGGVGGDDSGPTKYAFGVATAVKPETQVAGTEGDGSVSATHDPYKLDDKKTDMPSFRAPYQSDDLKAPPVLANAPVDRQEKQWDSNTHKYVEVTVQDPPAPVEIEAGGYESIDVPQNQTLLLKSGVYYFHEEMKVSGKIKVEGSTPVVIFVGKKAIFNNAQINPNGKASALQLCFTDEIKDELELDKMIPDLMPYFDAAADPDDAGGLPTGAALEQIVKNIVAPITPGPEGEPPERQGASLLEITGGDFTGSISGKNLVAKTDGGEIFGGIMGNIVKIKGSKIHQDLALKGSNLMTSGGWELDGVHQLR